jgi:hypothetical protein
MEREDHIETDLIDLGLVVEETKGSGSRYNDGIGGLQNQPGLSDD